MFERDIIKLSVLFLIFVYIVRMRFSVSSDIWKTSIEKCVQLKCEC